MMTALVTVLALRHTGSTARATEAYVSVERDRLSFDRSAAQRVTWRCQRFKKGDGHSVIRLANTGPGSAKVTNVDVRHDTGPLSDGFSFRLDDPGQIGHWLREGEHIAIAVTVGKSRARQVSVLVEYIDEAGAEQARGPILAVRRPEPRF